ncbi:LON peptidase substrate-binding domain-containing protein [Tahibacter amnicola]|uniref:LON peptidase substrate-binding domain-containing protein n=1 Tax=Tahibacter amnicola TaxID=2976241 RepID=A0ABY6BGS6_9GAMM|nr:LON peptidase substrate-binding domain-containing protein [Tahibacter amnicola]UXI69045.1 LON peptidase substrate-binding domain-containing protein [Tahibacter amnicola]
MNLDDIPLFPLSTVLFPGSYITLRIFEPRYVDLVRHCTRTGSGFGISLILEGREAGEPALPAAVGTLGMIEDFFTLSDGLLGIRVRGSRRFKAKSTRIRDNGLIHAQVRWWAEEARIPVPPEYSLLCIVLERLLEQVGGDHAKAERSAFDDASWVSFRLAQLLPVEDTERQRWLELTDPIARLDELLHCIPRFQSA